MTVQVRLLGPVDVAVDGVARPMHGLRRKAVLSVLALSRGEIVSRDHLIDAVWGGSEPSGAVNSLQAHVSYLRSVLGRRSAIVPRSPGYVLAGDAITTDVEAADELIHRSLGEADPRVRVERLTEALRLWRGRPLVDAAGSVWLEHQADHLDRLWLTATASLFEARLSLGEHAQVMPDLERLAGRHPLDERLQGQLMLALYRGGRQADAIATYHRLRHTLARELGIDPGQELRELEAAILRQDPDLLVPSATPVHVHAREHRSGASDWPDRDVRVVRQLSPPVDPFRFRFM